jgi:polar amino acid transport system substrate-binding protein
MCRLLIPFALVAILAAACGPEEDGGATTPAESPTDGETAPPTDGTTTPTESAPPLPADCAAEASLVTEGTLTIGADNPGFPPWFNGADGGPWVHEDQPAPSGGFEAAVAFEVARHLGFRQDQMTWTAVRFNQSFRPGEKPFDFYITQVSFSEKRARAVDFSDSYYEVNQALVAIEGTPITDATTLEDLREFTLGAPVGTTSYDYIVENIQPEQEPGVYDELVDVNSALAAGQIDGEVVDLPTAFFITGAEQVENSVVVGQFPTVGEQEHFGMVFEKDKEGSLLDCVNAALTQMRDDGVLAALQEEWLAQATGAPVFEA